MKKKLRVYVSGLTIMLAGLILSQDIPAQDAAANQNAAKGPVAAAKPEDTEQWEPVPVKVSPGAKQGAVPSDAIVLFDGQNLDQWVMAKDGSPARWHVDNGTLVVDKAVGNIKTKRLFKNYQLH